MVYTKLALRWQQFHVAPAMQQPKSAISTPLPWILIIHAVKGYILPFRITSDMCAVSLLESRDECYIKAMNNNNVTTTETDLIFDDGVESLGLFLFQPSLAQSSSGITVQLLVGARRCQHQHAGSDSQG